MKNRFVTEAEEFLAGNQDHDAGWPKLSRTKGAGTSRGRVFIWGDLAVDLPIACHAQISTEILARWRTGEALGCPCEIGKPALGGFVGHLAPIAAEFGFDVHIACSVSLPAPSLIRAFLESGRFDTRHVIAFPGPAPLTLKLKFADRCVRISHPGISACTTPQIPENLGDEYNAVLIDPGSPEGRSERLKSLVGSCHCETSGMQLGVVGRSDWSAAELGRLAEQRLWLFLTERDVIELADRLTSEGQIADARQAATKLKRRLSPSVRLVVTRGEKGTWLMNGAPQPQPFGTSRALRGRAGGAPDVLAAYTLFSSMLLSTDEAAARMGVNADDRRRRARSVGSVGEFRRANADSVQARAGDGGTEAPPAVPAV